MEFAGAEGSGGDQAILKAASVSDFVNIYKGLLLRTTSILRCASSDSL